MPRLKMLEIGLGCGMPYGPGASIPIWHNFFKDTNLTLHMLEFNQVCAQQYVDKVDMMFIGGQRMSSLPLRR